MFHLIQTSLQSLVRDDRGVTLVEYGIALTLLLILGVTALTTLGGEISTALGVVGTQMPD